MADSKIRHAKMAAQPDRPDREQAAFASLPNYLIFGVLRMIFRDESH